MKNLRRGERKQAVLKAFAYHKIQTGKSKLTAAKIARYMGKEPSSHIRSILSEMVENGQLLVVEIPDEKAIQGFVRLYKVNQPKVDSSAVREIVINGFKQEVLAW